MEAGGKNYRDKEESNVPCLCPLAETVSQAHKYCKRDGERETFKLPLTTSNQ